MESIFIINWWALLVNIAWSAALGMIWYSPKVFFRPWQEAVGLTEEMMKEGSPGRSMALGMLANSISVYGLGVLVKVTGAATLSVGCFFGCFLGLFIVTASEINNGSFRMTKPVVYLIDGGYRVLMMSGAGALFAVWQ